MTHKTEYSGWQVAAMKADIASREDDGVTKKEPTAEERRAAAAEYRARDEAAVAKLLAAAEAAGDEETVLLCREGLSGGELAFEDAIEIAEERWGTA